MEQVEHAELTQEQVDAILAALDHAGRKLPVGAIEAVRQNKTRLIPELIKLIHREAQARCQEQESEGNGGFFALFLLAELRAVEGLPAILDAISLPGEGPFKLFGDAIHDVLPRVLVSLAGDRCIEVCSALVRNPAANEYVRWSSAKAIVYLAMAGLRPRNEVMAACQELLHEAIEKNDEHAVTGLVMSMLDMRPSEAAKEFEQAFQLRLMDEEMIDWESVKDHLKEGPIEPSHEYSDPPCVEDTVKELEHWASFQEPKPSRPTPAFQMPRPIPPSRPLPKPVTQTRQTERVGRNDACPCASGKKVKRCCGGRQ